MLEIVKIDNHATAKAAQVLASEIWHEHYASIISSEQIDYMLESQSADAIEKLIPNGYTYYLIRLDENDIGYTAVCTSELLENRMLISKLYIKREFRGKGIGTRVVKFHGENAKKEGFSGLYVFVNKKNTAIQAYGKMGFRVHHPVITEIGNGFVMDDFVMSLDF